MRAYSRRIRPHSCKFLHNILDPCIARSYAAPIVRLTDLQGKKLGICVSGGLDSKTVALRLKEAGCDVVCFTADLGQPDETDIEDIRERMAPTGTETIIVDLKHQMAEACFMMVRAQAMYDGGYWNTTGIARAVTVKGLLGPMREHDYDVLVHGATGRGNTSRCRLCSTALRRLP